MLQNNSNKKVLFIDNAHPILREELENNGFSCDFFPYFTREDFLKIIECYNGVIIRSKIVFDKEIIDKAINLKFIARVGAGMESINVSYAEKKQIICLNSPEGNRDAVGEHALGMLLTLLNNIYNANEQIKNHIWEREGNRGLEIKNKTIGIIGYGNMGSAFAQRLKGFDCKILAYDKYKKDFGDENVKESSLNELFNDCDIVSLHIPLTDETQYLVNNAFIDKFKKSIYLINTARGLIVKTTDLINALKQQKVLGAALDVIEYEDTSFENLKESFSNPNYLYLQSAKNVIMTPHIAGWTVESKYKLAKILVDKILELYKPQDIL